MRLDNFENHVEEQVMDRGFDDWENGLVKDIMQVEPGRIQALVEGTGGVYDVFVELAENSEVASYGCNCPYDWEGACKHVVALLYHIRHEALHEKGVDDKIRQLEQDVLLMEDTSLKQLLLKMLRRNRHFREAFLAETGAGTAMAGPPASGSPIP